MIRWLALPVLLVLSVGTAGAIDARAPLADAQKQERYERMIREIRCLVCQNEPIADSNAPLASDLRREVRERIEAGHTDAEILSFLTARYGDFVLYRPPFTPRTWLLWLAPGLLLLIGGWVFWRVISSRAGKPIDRDWVDPAEDASK
ncbi:MAG: cytochrome c-type biogenesis protein CcmH [Gammaproteobacteria bacterium]|nr:cytochrome c-type biogenesis protein CcmH [Gammaproteobacteria bacterium]